MAGRATFGSTWWGREWVAALEDSADVDAARLSRGRTYARRGAVGPVEIGRGFARAQVTGERSRLYRTDITVRTLAPGEWDEIALAVAGRAGHAAALLDGELPREVLEDARSVEIDLVPTPVDIRPDCSCPDWAEPCKHAAGLFYLVADLIDDDPFVLFELRGVEREEFLSLVRHHRRPDDVGTVATPSLGIDATVAWANTAIDSPLPPIDVELAEQLRRHRPRHVGVPAPLVVSHPESFPATPRQLDDLAADAAARAFAMIVDGEPSGLRLPPRADLARRAASMNDPRAVTALARRLGLPDRRLEAWADAWVLGGAEAVAIVSDEGAWVEDPQRLSEGREELVAAGLDRKRIALNYDSLRMADNVWLAIGTDLRWYKVVGAGKRLDLHLASAPLERHPRPRGSSHQLSMATSAHRTPTTVGLRRGAAWRRGDPTDPLPPPPSQRGR